MKRCEVKTREEAVKLLGDEGGKMWDTQWPYGVTAKPVGLDPVEKIALSRVTEIKAKKTIVTGNAPLRTPIEENDSRSWCDDRGESITIGVDEEGLEIGTGYNMDFYPSPEQAREIADHLLEWSGRYDSPNDDDYDLKKHVTREIALQIREWRCEGPCSFRLVAQKVFEKYGIGVATGHPIYGEDLCRFSAELLGEDFNGGTWN